LSELETLAQRLWSELRPGAVVWLTGDLGTGKTALVQAVARAAGAGGARSPSFALVHEYDAPDGLLVHVDCYRLRDPEEAADLDFRGLERRARALFVEWPERAGHHAPPPDVRFELAHTGDPDRRIVRRVG
jgi:tRNA threonylcarbamoyladenosine biosynthesis protein TsaE